MAEVYGMRNGREMAENQRIEIKFQETRFQSKSETFTTACFTNLLPNSWYLGKPGSISKFSWRGLPISGGGGIHPISKNLI